MFDELDKNNPVPTGNFKPAGPAPAKAEDIFSEVDNSVKPEVFRPKINDPMAIPDTVIPAETTWLKNKGLIFGLVIGGLIIIFGGFIILKLMIKDDATVAPVKEEAQNTQTQTPTQEVTEPMEEEVATSTNQLTQPIVTEPLDTDLDGLTDEEEGSLRTDINSSDTDQDGLTDREEVKVYSTDPLQADTDGDGYSDGEEVKNGFNPSGEGKLLDINNQ
jgi:hypothetical protein